jgi:hypothetical protein
VLETALTALSRGNRLVQPLIITAPGAEGAAVEALRGRGWAAEGAAGGQRKRPNARMSRPKATRQV